MTQQTTAVTPVAAAYVVMLRSNGTLTRNEVLLHLRAGTGYRDGHWALPSGHIEPGESVIQAAVREAAEETGVAVDPDSLEPLTALHRYLPGGGPADQRVDMFFIAHGWRGEPSIQEPHKAAGMGWFPLHALPEPVVPHEREVLDMLTSRVTLPAIMCMRRD